VSSLPSLGLPQLALPLMLTQMVLLNNSTLTLHALHGNNLIFAPSGKPPLLTQKLQPLLHIPQRTAKHTPPPLLELLLPQRPGEMHSLLTRLLEDLAQLTFGAKLLPTTLTHQ